MPRRPRDPDPLPVKTGRRDWGRILADLAQAGMPAKAVARKIGRSTHTLQAWAAGGEPRERDGRMVLALYARHCPAQYLVHQQQYAIRVQAPAPLEALPGGQC